MKKRNIIIASASLLSAMAIGAGIVGISPKAAEVKAEGEKEVISFNITTFHTLNDNVVLLDTDKTMPSFSADYVFKWTVDNQIKDTLVLENNGDQGGKNAVYFAWAGTKPVDGDKGYHHWHLEAGTIIYEDDSSKYVLEKDYNFWYSRHSGGGDFSAFVWQHGAGETVSEIPSFSFSDSTNTVIHHDLKSWRINIPFVKSSAWSSATLYNGNPLYYAMNGSSSYELGYNGDSADHNLAIDGELPNASYTTGTALFILSFNGFDTTSGADKEISFFFPKGTLFGGQSAGYYCFLENDYYVTALKDYVVGTTASSQSLFYQPVTDFVSNYMHMSDVDYEGDGTGLCVSAGTYSTAKDAYTNLSSIQKFFFRNSALYTDAFNRLTAWATANGETLNSATGEISKSSSFTILGDGDKDNNTLYYAVLAVSALLVITVTSAFYFRKKRHN